MYFDNQESVELTLKSVKLGLSELNWVESGDNSSPLHKVF